MLVQIATKIDLSAHAVMIVETRTDLMVADSSIILEMVEIMVIKFIAPRSCVDKFDMTARSCIRCYKSNVSGNVKLFVGHFNLCTKKRISASLSHIISGSSSSHIISGSSLR